MIKIKESTNTIYSRVFYWVSENGYIISVVRSTNSLISDSELKEILLERVNDYLNA